MTTYDSALAIAEEDRHETCCVICHDWTDSRLSLAEAIPPAYTEHIGAQLLEAVRP